MTIEALCGACTGDGAIVGSRDGAKEEERVCVRSKVSMVALYAKHDAPKLATTFLSLRASRYAVDRCRQSWNLLVLEVLTEDGC